MEANTLYYTFSTVAQVVAAIVTILAAFAHFRMQSLRELLIGHGLAVQERWGEPGYGFPGTPHDSRDRARLRDAIHRRSVPEIRDIIGRLSDAEAEAGLTLEDRPAGLQYVFKKRFCTVEDRVKYLRRLTLRVVFISFGSILLSVVSLVLTETLASAHSTWIGPASVWVNVAAMILVMGTAGHLVYTGLAEAPEG